MVCHRNFLSLVWFDIYRPHEQQRAIIVTLYRTSLQRLDPCPHGGKLHCHPGSKTPPYTEPPASAALPHREERPPQDKESVSRWQNRRECFPLLTSRSSDRPVVGDSGVLSNIGHRLLRSARAVWRPVKCTIWWMTKQPRPRPG